jgi:hypothetical protein
MKNEETELTPLENLAARIGADATDPDFCFGAYVFCMDFHGGQWSEEYAAMCETGVSMRDSHIDAVRRGRDDRGGEWEAARMVYRALKREWTARVR